MSTSTILKRIGGRLREESRDIVEVELPERVCALLRGLAVAEGSDKLATQCGTQERR